MIEESAAQRNARAGGVDGAERSEAEWSGVDTPSPGIPRSGANGDHPSRSARPTQGRRDKTTVEGQNTGWRTKLPVARRSGDKTPGFQVTGFLVWDGSFGLDGDGSFGKHFSLIAEAVRTIE